VNIFLLPYTWMRHLAMAFWCGGAGLIAWWLVLTTIVQLGIYWPPSWDGPVLMCSISMAVACASIAGECALRRRPVARTALLVALTAGIALGLTLIWYYLWHLGFSRILYGLYDAIIANSDKARNLEDAADHSLVSLSFRAGAFAMGGLASGMSAMIVRKLQSPVAHSIGGAAAGMLGGACWYVLCSTRLGTDLYHSGMALGLVWGVFYGLLAWPIPDELYAGWVRVLSGGRFSRRIPVDALDGAPKERFVGHFPRGLDLFVPVEEGVQEMHLSVAVDSKRRYTARGLSLYPTTVHRFLERVDLRYDPRRPAPLETNIASGDRIVIGDGASATELEFILLPKEEL
jgi:hypothetical protein